MTTATFATRNKPLAFVSALITPPNRYWLIALLLVVAGNFAWSEITRTRGAQQVSYTPAEQTCGTVGQLRYCVNKDRRGTNGDIVYHLHGRNLDETVWNDNTYMTAMFQGEWQRSATLPPTVISVSYGPNWLLAPRGEKPASGLLEDFMARVSEIEARVGAPRRRMLLGESMGGLNVLVAGLSYPSQFAKIAALCPGVYAVSPFAELSTKWEALKRTGAAPERGLAVWQFARTYLAGEADWRLVSPLHLIENAGPGSPALYLSNGLYDGLGNFEGTQMLASRARARGVEVTWHPLYGGHCATDAPSLAAFLIS
jgi:S-formylglutathione hydrolase FrmB